MSQQFFNESTQVEIALLSDQRINRDFFIIKLRAENRFLTSSIGCSLRRNWKKSVKHAATFQDLEHAQLFAMNHFCLV